MDWTAVQKQVWLRPAVLILSVFAGMADGQDIALNETKANEFFESRIRPILVKKCYECHSTSAGKKQGGLYLDHRSGIRNGGDTGPAVVPGNLDDSLLVEALRYDGLEMPPDGKLSEEVIRDFEKWIKDGAIDPREIQVGEVESQSVDWAKAKQSWTFQVPEIQPLPDVKDRQWPRNRIDYFVLAKLEEIDLVPMTPAPRRDLVRRLAFDLTGLPPKTIKEDRLDLDRIGELDIDQRVERLLASPAFGEKWSRFWLDLARYAEDQAHIVGNNQALFYPNAYLYRKWVIDSFNSDLPYDQFVREQMAIDLIGKEEGRELTDDELAALGFIGLGPKYYRRNDLSVMADEWEDRVDTVSRGLIGLTVACARCHDHKYDPIATEDYYALAGVFASTDMYNKPRKVSQTADLNQTGKKKKNKKNNSPGSTLHIVKDKNPKNLKVFVRGDPQTQGALVERRFLSILDPEKRRFDESNSGRLDLANAIVDRKNPLFAKVLVNRVWGELFGQPIVRTPSNFGALGDSPSHPELLDDLSYRFMENNWSLKWLIREIVASRTYRQSSVAAAQAQELDPENRLLSRMNRKRLGIEQWRDAILFATDSLDREIGGNSIDPMDTSQRKRTIYSKVSRFQLSRMLSLFDFPDPNSHAAKRSETISPLQKMFALNSSFLLENSASLYHAIEKSNGSDMSAEDFVEIAFQRVYQRLPSSEEKAIAGQYLQTQNPGSQKMSAIEQQRRTLFLQSLLISNEFSFID